LGRPFLGIPRAIITRNHDSCDRTFVEASSLARAARSGFGTAFFFNLVVNNGRFDLSNESSRIMRKHSPRALSRLEPDACLPDYRLLENKTERQTVSSTGREQENLRGMRSNRPVSPAPHRMRSGARRLCPAFVLSVPHQAVSGARLTRPPGAVRPNGYAQDASNANEYIRSSIT
jgi:hypothetical protein